MFGSDLSESIDETIRSNDVVVFSKSYCPHCKATKRLFQQLSVEAKVIELDLMENGAMVQQELAQKTLQRTVPNVFVKGKHIGGNDKTQAALRTGHLEQLLKV